MQPAAVTDFAPLADLRRAARAQDPAALRQTAQQFEGLLIQQMLKSMRAASLGEDLLGGAQMGFHQEQFDAQIAQHLAARGGLGLADVLVQQMQRQALSEPAPVPANPPPAPAAAVVAGPRAAQASSAPVPGAIQRFVDAVRPYAERAARALGISPQVLVAQAALETGWGRSARGAGELGPGHNVFGIKADARWGGERQAHRTHEFEDGALRPQTASFRAYGSLSEAFADYVQFIKGNPRYREALAHGGDARRFVEGIARAGYATDPDYAQKILRIAESPVLRAAFGKGAGS